MIAEIDLPIMDRLSMSDPVCQTYGAGENDQFFDTQEYHFFAFLSLPIEVRYEVYEHIVQFNDGRNFRTRHERYHARHKPAQETKRPLPPILNLMMTNHQLYEEILNAMPYMTEVITKRQGVQWQIHPIFRHAKYVRGYWNQPSTGKLEPSIRYEEIQSKLHNSVNVKMFLNMSLEPISSRIRIRPYERLANALRRKKENTVDLEDFIAFDQQSGPCVSVWIYIEDRTLGRHVLTCVVQKRVLRIMKRHQSAPTEEEITKVFRDVWGVR